MEMEADGLLLYQMVSHLLVVKWVEALETKFTELSKSYLA